MAKSSNLPAKKYKAGTRACTKIRLMADFDDASGQDRNKFAYVDLAQCLSVLNQRAYRQGLYYYVASVTVHNTADARVVFSTAPDTWVTKQAWARGWKAWMRMQREAMQETGMIQAKYADYKVYLDDDHKALEVVTAVDLGDDDSNDTNTTDNVVRQPGNNLLPVAYDKLNADTGEPSGNELLVCDEWAVSEYVASDHGAAGGPNQEADAFTAHIVGNHEGTDGAWDSVGLIYSYVTSRAPQQQQVPDAWSDDRMEDDPIVAVFDHGDTHEAVVKDIGHFNDSPPYDRTTPFGYRDDQLYQVGQCKTQAAGGGSIVRLPGFCVPFGLLRIDVDDTSGCEIVIDMVPGTYHGVYAERVI